MSLWTFFDIFDNMNLWTFFDIFDNMTTLWHYLRSGILVLICDGRPRWCAAGAAQAQAARCWSRCHGLRQLGGKWGSSAWPLGLRPVGGECDPAVMEVELRTPLFFLLALHRHSEALSRRGFGCSSPPCWRTRIRASSSPGSWIWLSSEEQMSLLFSFSLLIQTEVL